MFHKGTYEKTFKHEWCFSEANIRFGQLKMQVRMNPESKDSQRRGQSIQQTMNIFSVFEKQSYNINVKA